MLIVVISQVITTMVVVPGNGTEHKLAYHLSVYINHSQLLLRLMLGFFLHSVPRHVLCPEVWGFV